ncbi:MAG: AAA family ATPase [Proteobacteria bacterium]|nr:AAA family ATPase [Pseudomonadota bacterium]
MDETEFLQQLLLNIRAHYPVLLIETADEDWIVDALRRELGSEGTVVVTDHLEADSLKDPPSKQKIVVWQGATELDWQENDRELRRHARKLRTPVTLVMMSQSWGSLVLSEGGLCVLRAPLPSLEARSTIARLVLGLAARDQERLDRIVSASAGMTRTQLYRSLSKAMILNQKQKDYDGWASVITSDKKALMSRASTLEIIDDVEVLDNVGGAKELKIWLRRRSVAFSSSARAFGISAPRGLLLVGVQGCGKSLLAKAVASEWHFPLLRLDMSTIFAGSAGNPDAALASALDVADAMAPAVIWCDEIEKSFSDSNDTTTRRLLGHILNWLQERHSKTFFVATANDIETLPPELMRKGRFDEIFFVDLPDESARNEIFAIHLRRRGRDPQNFDCAKLAEEARNFSGAEIEQAVMDALFNAYSHKRELTTDDLLDAIQDTTPLYKQREDDIKRLREWAADRTRGADQNRRLLEFFK